MQEKKKNTRCYHGKFMFRNKFIFHGHLNLLAWRNGSSSSFTFDANQFAWHASHSSWTFLIYILAVTAQCSRRCEPMRQNRRCRLSWNRIYSKLSFKNWGKRYSIYGLIPFFFVGWEYSSSASKRIKMLTTDFPRTGELRNFSEFRITIIFYHYHLYLGISI